MKTIKIKESEIIFGEISELVFEGSVLIISDEQVASLYLQRLMPCIKSPRISTLTLPCGEENKSFSSLQKILDVALEQRLDRQSTMVALGGGVISDLVGLASGLFMRGIDFCNIPTTLLAQVDASVGGKCGINTSYGKNLIGLFHQPRKVWINPSFLQSLSQREFNAGMAEVIKLAICFSPWLFERLFDPQWVQHHLLEVIYESVSIKASIVTQDEKEQGIRSALNYGHTFGHAIEREQNYQGFLHGEAVSLGMVMANLLAKEIFGFAHSHRVVALLQTYHLPTQYRIKNLDLFFHSLFLDKKTQKGQIKFILPKMIGSFDFYLPTQEEIFKTLSEFAS